MNQKARASATSRCFATCRGSNGARTIWITETALATGLNVSYMAEQISIFGIVAGIALLLTGVGLLILEFAAFGRYGPRREALGT